MNNQYNINLIYKTQNYINYLIIIRIKINLLF